MKKITFNLIKIACWLVFPLLNTNAQTGFVDDFNDNILSGNWYGSKSYILSETGGVMNIQCQKTVWDEFGINLPNIINITVNPVVSFKFKSGVDCYVNLALLDNNNNSNRFNAPRVKITGGADYIDISFNFAGKMGSVNASKIKQICLIVNPAYNYKGIVYIDDFHVGDQASIYPTVWVPNSVYLTNGGGNQNLILKGLSTGATVTATSSNTAAIPNPTVSGSVITFTPPARQTDSAIITLTVAGTGYTNLLATFKAFAYSNLAPSIKQVKNVVCSSGISTIVNIDSIYDGNPDKDQTLIVTAVSSDQTVLQNSKIIVALSIFKSKGTLTFTPEALVNGSKNCTVTVTVKDNGGNVNGGEDTKTMTFNILVFSSYYKSPTVDRIADNNFGYADDKPVTVIVTGITDGNGSNKVATVTASADAGGAVVDPVVVAYTPGSSIAYVTYKVATTGIGKTSVISVVVTNTGAPVNSNGNTSTTTTFEVKGKELPITGNIEPFNMTSIYGADFYAPTPNPKSDDWRMNTDMYPGKWYIEGQGTYQTLTLDPVGAKATFVCQIPGSLPYCLAGKMYSPRKIYDLSSSPYISATLSMNPARKIIIDLIDVYGKRYGLTESKAVTPKDSNYTYTFFSPSDPTFDITKVAAILFNFNEINSYYNGTVTLSDFRIGDQVLNAPPFPDKIVVFDTIGNRTITQNSGLINVPISHIRAMQGKTLPIAVTLTATSNNTNLIANPVISDIVEQQAILTFTPEAGQTGTATINITGSATDCSNKVQTFEINVITPNANSAINIIVTPTTTYQTMTGLGNMIDAAPMDQSVTDMGCSVFRMDLCQGDVGYSLEPVNDNQDPNILDISKFEFPKAQIDLAKQAIDLGVTRFIGSVWSAPYWMKMNLSGGVPFFSNYDNEVDPVYYDEFAEWIAGVCMSFKEATGVELLAVSVQNEPEFDEYYGSGRYTAVELNNLARVTGLKLATMGLSTKIFFGENIPAVGPIVNYLKPANDDTVTSTFIKAFAIHNYDADGINVENTGCYSWISTYNETQRVNPKKENWMTESSLWTSNIKGGMMVAGNLYNALSCGNINLWTIWHVTRDNSNYDSKEVFGVHKNYYFVKPGAQRIDAVSSNKTDVLSIGFKNADGTFVIIAINRASGTRQVNITGTGLPNKFKLVQTSVNQYAEEVGIVFSPNYTTVLPANSVTTFIGSVANIAPTINKVANFKANPTGMQTLQLSGISPVETNQNISSITVTSANQTILPNANISITNPVNGSATLSFTPAIAIGGLVILTVTVKDDGGIASGGLDTKTMTFEIEFPSIENTISSAAAKCKVYPNPTKNIVTVTLPSDNGSVLSLYDIKGTLVLTKTVDGGQKEVVLDLQSIAKGVHVLKVDDGNNIVMERIIKE